MGWANCGTDEYGRPIGYAWPAVCDYPGCDRRIDRGLGYVCGTMHGGEDGCGRYYCDTHGGGAQCPFCATDRELPPLEPAKLVRDLQRLYRLYATACDAAPDWEPTQELVAY